MGSFCTPSYSELPSASDTYSANEVPSWVSSAGRSLFEKAAEIAASDYPTYSGDRIATYGDDNSKLTDQEREGMEMLGTLDDTFKPYLDDYTAVADTLGQGYDAATREELMGDPFSMDTAQPFMDIYQDAMNPAVREIEEQTIRAQNEARSRAARGGGAFGSRLGIMEGTAAGEGAKAAGDLRATAGREGLDFAAGRFDTERANRFSAENALRSAYETEEAAKAGQMDAYATAGTLAADLQAQTAQGLITSGEATRLLDQRALDLAYADYLDQRDYPQEQLNFALGALSQTPYSKASRGFQTGTQMAADPSVYGQTLSGLGSLFSAYKLMNQKPG
jgi:hypothetical protein